MTTPLLDLFPSSRIFDVVAHATAAFPPAAVVAIAAGDRLLISTSLLDLSGLYARTFFYSFISIDLLMQSGKMLPLC